VSRHFGSLFALDEVSFSMDAGDFLVIVGPNGAGKTTLVRTLARLARPSSGTVRLTGDDWLAAPAERQVEVGVVSHATFLYDGLSALENLVFYATLYGVKDPERSARQALEDAELSSLSDRRAGTLSRGQAQRLSIARSALHDPRILLLDEPYAGLDPHAASRLGVALGRLRSAGRAIVLTTHDLARVPAAVTHYLVLVAGRVADSGEWSTLAEGELADRYSRAVARTE
jgi:heme exporter protein A